VIVLEKKFTVIKDTDIKKYLDDEQLSAMEDVELTIGYGRKAEGKPVNNTYLVVNTDEPYAELVENLILGEITASEIVETIARNCVAWDTSKDKREGLLPEVAMFKNPSLYKRLTGEEYVKYKAIKKFHIGEDY
jgi:hypothetical protein